MVVHGIVLYMVLHMVWYSVHGTMVTAISNSLILPVIIFSSAVHQLIKEICIQCTPFNHHGEEYDIVSFQELPMHFMCYTAS